jgi:FtsP/CotA-like multicopper oxidase with cupredoxin domain
MRTYGYRIDDGTPDATPGSAPLLLLKTNQPTDIVVRNLTPDATSIHWHGIEIEAYSDGVVGVGGYAHMPIPPIMPGDSFVARVTVPRSGSFMYHTHVSDINQQGKGLAGPIVVVDDPAGYDAVHERVYLVHTWLDVLKQRLDVRVNDDMGESPPDTVRAGETYRLRFMNITLANTGVRFQYVTDKGIAVWTDVAKDGFDLPNWQEHTSPDPRPVSIGETRDVTWEPVPNSSGWMELRNPGGGLVWRQRIEVVD